MSEGNGSRAKQHRACWIQRPWLPGTSRVSALQQLGEASSASWGPLLPRSPKPLVPADNTGFDRGKAKKTSQLAFCFHSLPHKSNSLTWGEIWGVVAKLFPRYKPWFGAGNSQKVSKQALDTRRAWGLLFVAIGALHFPSWSAHPNSYEPLGPRWLHGSVLPRHLRSIMRYKKAIIEFPLSLAGRLLCRFKCR